MSAGRSGRFPPRVTARRPLRHTVNRSDVPGSGPRSRSSTSGASASGAVAMSSVRRISGRLVTWLIAAPSANSFWKAFRSSGADLRSCRCSSISMFGVRCRTQISDPVPSASRATDSDRPSARFDRSTASTTLPVVCPPTSRPMYAAMNPQPATNAIRNRTDTSRSAFFACALFSGSASNGGSAGGFSTSTLTGVGAGVPITR